MDDVTEGKITQLAARSDLNILDKFLDRAEDAPVITLGVAGMCLELRKDYLMTQEIIKALRLARVDLLMIANGAR